MIGRVEDRRDELKVLAGNERGLKFREAQRLAAHDAVLVAPADADALDPLGFQSRGKLGRDARLLVRPESVF